MSIVKFGGSEVIKLQGFDINGEIVLDDSDRIGDYKKVTVLLPKDYLEFLIKENQILDDLNIDITVW